ncbi:MAG: LysR family transcriptional regulator [Sutterellaceae bacterium]|nr:LysR family transcriptional regulator [Sutterellaceae bacterium]MDD7441644.1 LysR family transcriptional regulator [Sutterellaceae bacterium]MDY2867972.1 LysR family transcriptional regulator [Mesosutterella sp.]
MKGTEELMDLALWELAVEVIDGRSITQAAHVRGIDRAQLSRKLSAFEKTLGWKLFERQGRTLRPTKRALEAADRVRPVLGLMREALKGLSEGDALEEGVIRFGAMPGFMQTQVVPMLVDFQKSYPRITFDVMTDEDPKRLFDGRSDLVLYYGPVHNPLFEEHLVTRSAFIPCAAPSYLKEKGQWLLEPPDLCRHSGILFTGRVRMHSEFLVRGTEEARYRFKSVLRFDSILAAKEAAVSGAGIALDIPLHHCFRDILEGRLVPVLSGWHVPNLNNCIAAANTAARLRRVQLFIRWYIGRRREIEEGQKKVLFEKFGLAY